MSVDTAPDLGQGPDPESLARRLVLRKLAARACTREELVRALQAKNVPAEVVSSVLDRMSEVGLVDDHAFAAAWVSSRQQRRHLSTSTLRRELRARGVDSKGIEDALQSVEPADEVRAAYALAERRHASMSGLDREVRYRRLVGLLTRRGFGAGVTAQVVGRVLAGDGLEAPQEDA